MKTETMQAEEAEREHAEVGKLDGFEKSLSFEKGWDLVLKSTLQGT